MSTVTLRVNAGAGIDSSNITSHITPSAYYSTDYYYQGNICLLYKFESLPNQYKYLNVGSNNSLSVYSKSNDASSGDGWSINAATVYTLEETFDEQSVTWETRPDDSSYSVGKLRVWHPGHNNPPQYEWNQVDYWTAYDIEKALKYGIILYVTGYGFSMATSAASSAYRPYLSIDFGSTKNSIAPTGNPQSGYVNPHAAITLKWSNSIQSTSLYRPEQTAATVTWKETGGEEHTIDVTTATSVTIPAEAWSAGTTYEWKVSVTDSGGTTTETGWYTLSTTAGAASSPTIVSPRGTQVDGSEPIVFRWTNNGTSNNTGTDIAIKKQGAGSDQITEHLAQGVSSYTLPAKTLSAGNNVWRARAYNADGVAGDWTYHYWFSVVRSPDVPYFEVTNTSPRPEVTWTAEDQIAWQVQIGEYDSGQRYGQENTLKCPIYLPDGQTEVRVRVMNQFNLWSDWATTYITIANSPGSVLPTLTVEANTDALLTWTPVPGATKYLIYRNDELIAETEETGATPILQDDLEVGSWSYSNKSASTTRCRTKELKPVAAGTVIAYNATTYDNYIGILATTTSSSYRQMTNWVNGAGSLKVNADGYMTLILQTHSTPHTAFTPEDWDGSVSIIPPQSYTDRYSNGETSYYIKALLGDNYAISNTVTVTVSVPCPRITSLDGEWIELHYSTDVIHTTQITKSQSVALMDFSGEAYPIPEIAPNRRKSYQIDVAFRVGESEQFEQLLGREVVLKDQYGYLIHGIMDTMTVGRNRFYTVISAVLEQIGGVL